MPGEGVCVCVCGGGGGGGGGGEMGGRRRGRWKGEGPEWKEREEMVGERWKNISLCIIFTYWVLALHQSEKLPGVN